MKSVIILLALLVGLQLHAEDKGNLKVEVSDINRLDCMAGNWAGLSRFSYNAADQTLTTVTMSVMGTLSTRVYEIGSVQASSNFGTTDFKIGRISFFDRDKSINGINYLVTATPLKSGEHLYFASWGLANGTPSGGPVSFMLIANLSCKIDVK